MRLAAMSMLSATAAADVSTPAQLVRLTPVRLPHTPLRICQFFDLSAVDINGNLQQFDQYRGNVVLVVNVATD